MCVFQPILGPSEGNFGSLKTDTMTIEECFDWDANGYKRYCRVVYNRIWTKKGPQGPQIEIARNPIGTTGGEFQPILGDPGVNFSTPQKLHNDQRNVVGLGHKRVQQVHRDGCSPFFGLEQILHLILAKRPRRYVRHWPRSGSCSPALRISNPTPTLNAPCAASNKTKVIHSRFARVNMKKF